MKKFLLLLLTFISPNVFAQNDYFKIKEGSFTHVAGAVMDDAKEHTDADDKPMAVFKISTENINNEERQKLYFTGNRVTEISDKVYKTGQVWIYLTAEDSEYLEIRHPDYGSTRFYFPESLCDFCTYEMVLQYIPLVAESANSKPILFIRTDQTDVDIYIDNINHGIAPNIIKDLSIGIHEIRLEKKGFKTITRTITIYEGENEINESMQLESADKLYEIGNTYYSKGDITKAIDFLSMAAEKGDINAQLRLGEHFFHGGDDINALKWYSIAAEKGNAEAQCILGDFYYNGQFVAKDYKEAAKWYTQSANQGNIYAQYYLANCYYNGIGIQKDHTKAIEWYKKSAETGFVNAQLFLGDYYYNGDDVKRDYEEAVKWYTLAAENGNGIAQYNLAECFYKGKGTDISISDAKYWYCISSSNYNSPYNIKKDAINIINEISSKYEKKSKKQYQLGNNYYFGKNGIAKDYYKAVEYYRKAAEQGFADAQCNLGLCYEAGQGVAKDHAEAMKWYRKAAEQGHAWAQNNLGSCYYNGEGVAKDYAEAVKWYRKAAEQSNEYAQYNLGLCYQQGNGVIKDYVEAVKWYRKAAEQGDEYAQHNLGVCYLYGYGVDKDLKKAKELFQESLNKGIEESKEKLEEIEEHERIEFAHNQKIIGDNYYNKKEYKTAIVYYRQAAELGNADAQNRLGICYFNGDGINQDYEEAIKLFRASATQDNKFGQYNLAYCYQHAYGVNKDLKKAKEIYQKAIDNGHENAKERIKEIENEEKDSYEDMQFNFGLKYDRDGDYIMAVEYYRIAAELGHSGAQNNLALCYKHGYGVTKDDTEAAKWLHKAAEQESTAAQMNLGNCYYYGEGVAKDYAEAVKWYRKAAEQGDAWAQNKLGNCYYNGEGVAKDYAEAAKWYRKAAEQGHAKAQYNLGLCYQYGNGVAKDLTKAKEWYQKAADNGDEDAKIKLKELSGTQQTNSISKIKVKGGSFKKINGFVMLDKYDHMDDNFMPMALIKISTENISAEQMRKFTFRGNRMTYFDVQFNLGEIHLYLSTAATYIEISHPDYGKTEFRFSERLCDYCGYEMTIVGE